MFHCYSLCLEGKTEIKCVKYLSLLKKKNYNINFFFMRVPTNHTVFCLLEATLIRVLGVKYCPEGLRDATESPGKSPIFSPLIGGGKGGVNLDFGRIKTKDSYCRDRSLVSWEN